MSNNPENNIIPFPSRWSRLQWSNAPVSSQSIIRILEPNFLKIHWERHTNPHYLAKSFFRILFSSWQVRISGQIGHISKNTLLTVADEKGEEFSLPVDYFVRLTLPTIHTKISDYDDYIMQGLTAMHIKISQDPSAESFSESILEDDEIPDYHPEQITAYDERWDYYVCEIYHEKHVPIWYSCPEGFQKVPLTLLDIMLSALDDTEINGESIQWASIDIIHFEWQSTHMTTIYGWRVEEVIFSALKRLSPLYVHMSFDSARKHYFDNKVLPKLSDIEEEENK